MGCMMHCWQILGSGSYIPNSAFGLPGRSLRDSTLDAGLRVAVLLQDARRVQQCRWWKGRGGLPLVHFFGNPKKKTKEKTVLFQHLKWLARFFLKLDISIQNMYCIGILAFAYIFQTAFVKVLNNSCEFCSIHPAPYCHKGWGPIELELFSSYNVAGFQPDLDSGWFPEALHSHESQAGVRVWISW